jgi:type IV pilus assembly protein PilV
MNARVHGMIVDARQLGLKARLRIPNSGTKPCVSTVPQGLRSQAGSMLLEAFIAILIFSMGILAIVGMQASAVKSSTDAKYRSEASLLANDLIGQMWASDRTPAVMQASFQGGGGTDGAAYTTWYSKVQATLPGSAAYPPAVNIDPATSIVTVAVQWKAPNDPPADPAHRFNIIAQIK